MLSRNEFFKVLSNGYILKLLSGNTNNLRLAPLEIRVERDLKDSYF